MTLGITEQTIDILLVEDSPTDAMLTKHAFSKAKRVYRIHVVNDGIEAMAFLRRQNSYADAPRPDLLLLDLNMPKMDGREVLAQIKADDGLKAIPVLILTTSSAEEDVLKSYQLHANAFITKPVGFDAFVAAVATLEDFWFGVVNLPPQANRL